jgi:acylphosphatase
MAELVDSTMERRRVVVQGVGFRPFIYGQALRWGLTGFVRNDSVGVTIEVEGSPQALDRFLRALREEAVCSRTGSCLSNSWHAWEQWVSRSTSTGVCHRTTAG